MYSIQNTGEQNKQIDQQKIKLLIKISTKCKELWQEN